MLGFFGGRAKVLGWVTGENPVFSTVLPLAPSESAMPRPHPPAAATERPPLAALGRCLAVALAGVLSSGCAVVALADVAATAAVGVSGLAVDAVVGIARMGGKIVGAGVDAVFGSDEAPEDD
jgi:hypothetical protein